MIEAKTFSRAALRMLAGATLSLLLPACVPEEPKGVPTTLWTTELSNAVVDAIDDDAIWQSIRFPDIDGDGRDDLCWIEPGESGTGSIQWPPSWPPEPTLPDPEPPANADRLYCMRSTGDGFSGSPDLAAVFPGTAACSSPDTCWFGPLFTADESYFATLQYADVDGDGADDLCYRGAYGIHCHLARLWNTEWGPEFQFGGFSGGDLFGVFMSDASGWIYANYYETIRFPDVDGDGRADVCGRGWGGIWCALSEGDAFGPFSLRTEGFGNPEDWHTSEAYWGTIRFADLNGDGRDDVCGRGPDGVECRLSDGADFGPVARTVSAFADDQGFASDPAYYRTIALADINGDGQAEICGRGPEGLYCEDFYGSTSALAPFFRDDQGYLDPSYHEALFLTDVSGDGTADACGRWIDGIYCARGVLDPQGLAFEPAHKRVRDFGDDAGWGAREDHWRTLRPANVTGSGGAEFCGRGYGGILCSLFAGF